MNHTLYTIGYSGLQLDNFVEQLQKADVELLIDIREIPISRKRGFSKRGLADSLERSAIQYRHFKWLGSPKSLRHEVRESRDYPTFFSGVTRHLQEPSAVDQLDEVVGLARQFRSCLMCFCENWQFCHRRCVIDELLKKEHFAIRHLLEPFDERTTSKAA